MLKENGNKNKVNRNKKKIQDRQLIKILQIDFSEVCKGEIIYQYL